MRFLLAVLGLLAPSLAFAAAPRTFSELAFYLVDIMGYAVGTLVLAALVLYFYGTIQHMIKQQSGKPDSSEQSKFFLIGILILFVMVSVWGILQILENTLLGTGQDIDVGTGGSDGGFVESFE